MCWLIANAEAKHLGATEILPIRFLLAVMKVIDPAFPGLSLFAQEQKTAYPASPNRLSALWLKALGQA